MTGEISPNVDDAEGKCRGLLGKLPIIKSETENSFILGLMSAEEVWVWLGMKRKQNKMVWFDDAPAEPSNGALYSAWKANEPTNYGNEDCAYMNFHHKKWQDNKCNYIGEPGPFVLCQKEREKNGSSKIDG